jgi:hypothetical protein
MMNRSALALHVFVALLMAISLNAYASSISIFNQLGGLNTVKSLSSSILKGAAGDSRTSGLFSGKDMGELTSKLSGQICSMTGGDCAAPLTKGQITAGAKKLTPAQSNALSDSFSKALAELKSSPAVKAVLNKTLGPSIGGILGGLL